MPAATRQCRRPALTGREIAIRPVYTRDHASAFNYKIWLVTGLRLGWGGLCVQAVYRQYTNDSFSAQVERSAEEEHLGLLGPLLRVEAGDVLEVVLRNNLPFEVSNCKVVVYDKRILLCSGTSS